MMNKFSGNVNYVYTKRVEMANFFINMIPDVSSRNVTTFIGELKKFLVNFKIVSFLPFY